MFILFYMNQVSLNAVLRNNLGIRYLQGFQLKMNINPTPLKSCLINKKNLPSNVTSKEVSFSNVVSVKNMEITPHEHDEDKLLTVSSMKEVNLVDNKDSRTSSFVPFASFLNLKTIIKDFFEKPVLGKMTAFRIYQEILTDNNPNFYRSMIESLLVSAENGGGCTMRQIANVCKNQHTLFSHQNAAISEEAQTILQALNNVTECKILGLQIKELESQDMVDFLREEVLSSQANKALFIRQTEEFIDNFVLLKTIIESMQ